MRREIIGEGLELNFREVVSASLRGGDVRAHGIDQRGPFVAAFPTKADKPTRHVALTAFLLGDFFSRPIWQDGWGRLIPYFSAADGPGGAGPSGPQRGGPLVGK